MTNPVKEDPFAAVTITVAEPADAELVMAILSACAKDMETRGIDQWDADYPTPEMVDRDIAARTLYVARVGERCHGTMTLDGEEPPEYEAVAWEYSAQRVLVVHRLAVDPRWQKRGLARALMDFAERHARVNGWEAIRLDAFTENPRAVALYQHRGYRRAGVVTFRSRPFHCFERSLWEPPPARPDLPEGPDNLRQKSSGD